MTEPSERGDRLAALVALVILLGVLSCASASKLDPNHGVSDASYRAVIAKVESNLALVRADMAAIMAADRDPTHDQAWRSAHLMVLDATALLCSDTLYGNGQ